MLELQAEQLHTWRTTDSVKWVETKSDQLRLRNTGPRQPRLTDQPPSLPSSTPSPTRCPSISSGYGLWSLLWLTTLWICPSMNCYFIPKFSNLTSHWGSSYIQYLLAIVSPISFSDSEVICFITENLRNTES